VNFIVTEAATGLRLDGIPTPALIENGGGYAYEQSPGIWRLRDTSYGTPGYDPEGTKYTLVRVEHQYTYVVDLTVEVYDPSDEYSDGEPVPMTLWVEARTQREAEDSAGRRAVERVREWAGDVPVSVSYTKTERQD